MYFVFGSPGQPTSFWIAMSRVAPDTHRICPNLTKYISDPKLLLLILLDPYSPLVPSKVKESWTASEDAYKLSRKYFYDIHKKREKMIEVSNELIPNFEEPEDKTEIIITLYKK